MIKVQGIFRVPGQCQVIDELFQNILKFDSLDKNPNRMSFDERLAQEDPHNLAGLLKKLVRSYPGSLISSDMTERMVYIFNKYPPNSITSGLAEKLSALLLSLNSDGLKIFFVLIEFLSIVSKSSFLTKECPTNRFESDCGNLMDVNNLAMVFAPNIFNLSASLTGLALQLSLKQITELTIYIIKNYNAFIVSFHSYPNYYYYIYIYLINYFR